MKVLPLALAAFKAITFEGVPPTAYTNDGAALVAKVEHSASFLLMPFDVARPARTLRFSYRLDSGRPPAHRDAAFEASKAGEDFLFRVGLLVSGPAPVLPFFAPAWAKSVREHAKLPADRIVFAVVSAAHPAGTSWHSPYGDDIELHAAAETTLPDGWQAASLALPSPLSIVGIWLMADGDDTAATFSVRVKDLAVEP